MLPYKKETKNKLGCDAMEGNLFKTTLFGGFRRADVAAYIEKSAAAANERIAALESDVDGLVKESNALRGGLAAAESARDDLAAELDGSRAELETLRAELDAAKTELEALRAEAELLRPLSAEYTAVKNSLAELELAAHRRADAYERETRERSDALLDGVRAQCGALLASLEETCANVTAELQRSTETVSRLPAAFHTLRHDLDELGKRE